MPVKMRLRRMGAKHQPSYRIVVADSRSPRDGRYIDQVGFYNPLTNPATVTLNQAKAIEWLQKGAQPTETVNILLKKFDINPDVVRKGPAAAVAAQTRPVAPPPASPQHADAVPEETTAVLQPGEVPAEEDAT